MLKLFPLTPVNHRNLHLSFKAQQLSGFSSKVEVISETSLIGNSGNLSSGAVNDNAENSSIFAALGGSSGSVATDHHSQIRGASNR